MDRMNDGRWMMLAVAAALAALCLLLLCSPQARAANDPPSGGGTVTGDWTVTDTRSYSGCTIVLDGNLTVTGTGSLTLDAVSLVMDASFAGQYGIDVESGGVLVLNGSFLGPGPSGSGYGLVVRGGGNITVADSELRGCGYAWGLDGESAGVCLLSDSCAFTGTLIDSGNYGVVVHGASPAFTDCRFIGNSQGCAVTNSSASFSGCTFENNGNGANLDNCSGSLSNCTFAYNSGSGILAYASGVDIEDCMFASNGDGGCVLMDSNATVARCTLRDSLYGLYISGGGPSVRGCTVTGDRYGAYLYKSSASFADCEFSQISLYCIDAFYGKPSLSSCKMHDNGYDPTNGFYFGMGVEVFRSELVFSGGKLSHNYYGIECRYSTLSVSDVEFTENSAGLHAFGSETYLTGCNFSRHLQLGALLSDSCTGALEGCGFTCETLGASFEHLTTARMANSTFSFCEQGLRLWDCGAGGAVEGCVFGNNSIGASMTGSSPLVRGCSFDSNFNFSLNCSVSSARISDCTFRDCPTDALALNGCGGVVDGNLFESNSAAGIYCIDSYCEISNNTFRDGVGSAIHSLGAGGAPDIHDNLISGNGIGIAFTGGSSGRIHGNVLGANLQAGISLAASHGEIYCNTVYGSVYGISCIMASDPSVHDNDISGNEGGILFQDGSSAACDNNSVHGNRRFGILAMMSWLSLSGNEVWGNLDGISIVDCPGPAQVTLAGDRVYNNTDGISGLGSSIDIADCNFTGNQMAGVYLANCTTSVRHSSFYMNRDGLHPDGGDIRVEECDFLLNNGTGIMTEGTVAVVDGCFFYLNTDGVLDLGNSSLAVYDGVYEQDLIGIWCGAGTDASWSILHDSMAIDDQFHLTGNLTVYYGGSLRLTNATLFMALEMPGAHGIEVQNGGRLEMLQGTEVGAADPDIKYTFVVQRGGNLTLVGGKVDDCGDTWGVAGERAGLLLLSSDCTLRNVYFYNCSYGLVANGITGDFDYLTFVSCNYGVVALSSRLVLENSSIYLSEVADIQLQQGALLTLFNTTFDRSSVMIQDPKCLLEVYWYLGVNVAWQNKVMVSQAELTLDDAAGIHQVGGYTDDHGWLRWVTVLEYRQNITSRDDRNPYTMMVRLANITSKQDMIFKKSVVLYLTLNDFTPPALEIDLPAEGALLNFTPVEIRGVAHDFETGLVSVEWSSDGRSWQPANGTEQWSLMAYLPDGNYSILVRATDAVGNRALQGLDFTVKTTITVLEITSPAEGQLTNIAAVLVNGSTEMGARVQINGRTVQVQLGKFSSTVFLDEGNNTILITATDDAGNTATVWRTVVLDTTAPFIELQSPRNGSYVNIMETVVSGRTEPGAKVLVNGQVLINSDGRFSQAVDLPDETNIINITVMDPAGNLNSTEVLVHVDTGLPAIDILYPGFGHHTSAGNIVVRGTTKPFSTVTMGEAVAATGEDGAFSLNITLLYGNNTLLVRSTDRAGNVNSTTWYVVRDRPSSGQNAPWMPAIVLFVVVLAAENAVIFGYVRRRSTPPPAASPVQEAPPDALPVTDEIAQGEEIPMATALPVGERAPAGTPASRGITGPSYRPPEPPVTGRPPGPPEMTQRPQGPKAAQWPPRPPQRPSGPAAGSAAPPGRAPMEEEEVETVEMR